MTSARDGVPLTVVTVVVCSQAGAVSGTRFWKNDRPRRAVGEALHEHRTAAHGAQQRLADAQVVLDEITLGLAALGEEHLAGAGEADLAAVELEDIRVVCHPADRTGAG